MNWILLRGLGRESRHWLDFPSHLKTAFQVNGAAPPEILCLDLPGFGTEKNHRPPFTIRENVNTLREKFLLAKKTREPWGLVGISLGGMIALNWAETFPEDFQALVVINSSASDLSSFQHRLSPYAMYRLLRAGLTTNVEKKERQILKMVSNLKAHDPSVRKTLTAIAKEKQVTPAKMIRQLAAAMRFQSPQKIDVPTLVLASIKDAMVDVRCSKSIAERLSAPIKFHPTAGHELTLDDPAWVAEKIREFTSSLTPAGS
jgi:pimeloyl-[acyl-carrier protein] methyl ester esterase